MNRVRDSLLSRIYLIDQTYLHTYNFYLLIGAHQCDSSRSCEFSKVPPSEHVASRRAVSNFIPLVYNSAQVGDMASDVRSMRHGYAREKTRISADRAWLTDEKKSRICCIVISIAKTFRFIHIEDKKYFQIDKN